jgi:hypothetical protein
MTKMWRKTTCKGCGFVQETTTTYYLDRKQWQANHHAYHLSVLPLKSQTPMVVSK